MSSSAPPPSSRRPYLAIAALILALLGLPFALWIDLRGLSDRMLLSQASTLTDVIQTVRSYYAANVVDRVLADPVSAHLPRHDYATEPGAIPIPATLSLELGAAIAAISGDVSYRFVSDYPFDGRAPHVLSAFEAEALAGFRRTRDHTRQVARAWGGTMTRQVQVVTPVVMERACIACHNSHPASARRDWQVGDVRGIQTIAVRQSIAPGFGTFRTLLVSMGLVLAATALFSAQQLRLTRKVQALNGELAENNAFLANVSDKVARYIPPQVFGRIFSGEAEARLSTRRKRLTVFMSDIVDFTQSTDRMQPEEITTLLNEYFTEMCRIADAHGATVDKFVGDAIVGFFGDPESRGEAEDAAACLDMALAMQDRMRTLGAAWKARGIEQPFRIRIGINTGYCDVGNFGSESRLDYTIIGVEANLTARLEGLASPGGIVLSYATYALVGDKVRAEALEPVAVKGISWPVVPYEVILPWQTPPAPQVAEHIDGFDLTLDADRLDPPARATAREALRQALRRLGPDGT